MHFARRHLPVLAACTLFLIGSAGCSSPPEASNPLDIALASGIPTLAEFGRGTCIPCQTMKVILDELAVTYKDRVNIVIISVDDYPDLTRQYGVGAIPTQIIFDSSGKKVRLHLGVWPIEYMVEQFNKLGVE